jgi:RNA polymerase sigma-70 factor (ECF subfamily)
MVLDALVESHYPALRQLAQKLVRRRHAEHRVDPTLLVHEAYLRLAQGSKIPPARRTAFLALAATVIRHCFVDLARQLDTLKRGAHLKRITLDGRDLSDTGEVDLLALDDALRTLARLDERQARIVELKFFGGLTMDEIAEALEVSARTVDADWSHAKAWLHRELSA